jgi:HAD superfamily hydrolase (TIGR01509 family)
MKHIFPISKQMAVIWDMDGVIIDSVPCHYQAWQVVFKNRGINYLTTIADKPFGHIDTIKSVMIEASTEDIAAVSREKEEIFKDILKKKGIHPLPGVIKLLDELKRQGFKLALASAASKNTVSLIIDTISIRYYFDTIICAEDVQFTKPDPEAFMLALTNMSVEATDSCVIEDMPSGISAARCLGIHCISITTNHSKEKLSKADLVVDSLEMVSTTDIINLINPENGSFIEKKS